VKTETRVGVFNGVSGRKRKAIRVPSDHLIFSSDRRLIAGRSPDGAVLVWDLPPRRPIGVLLALAAVPTLLFALLLWWRFGR